MTTQIRSIKGKFEWARLDDKTAEVVRALAVDAVEVDEHGHPDPEPSRTPAAADGAAGAERGGYVLVEASAGDGTPDVILIAAGGEVPVALRARDILEREGTPTRVVSMPCVEWFEEQTADYREAVLPRAVRARVSVEAGASLGWYAMAGTAGELVGLDHVGLAAPYPALREQCAFTPERVAAHARSSLAKTPKRD
ncbi:transketolase C-terminal domain-containing protein [Kitasatospora sp. MAP5-34]|uniref:transketolase-like TK C-terminal-containing protein n=1 Tax=Kitasatospora sp. MAP5-34 TaxID=3035102 RepID=UPI0024756D0A|nr:transketolase C-terminal domain-containing protein [Kitasatospora sp. MAP5-34]MDH6576305.1 transketolase [Kitasatospora sp. MAP5-34]